MAGYLSAGPNRAIVNIGAVDTENRLASGTFSDGSECGNIINTRNHVGAVQVTPAVGEQWVVEKGGDQLWVLITKLPIHTPDLSGDTKPSAGQVQIGSSGPLELFGSTINAHADLNAQNITIPEGNQLILNGIHIRTAGGILQTSTDGTTWGNVVPPPVDLPDSTDDLPEGTTNKYFTPERAAAAAPVQSVAGKTGIVALVKDDVGLGNVSNLTPLDLPLSTAATSALGSKADLIAGMVPDVQLPQLATSKITGLDTQLTGITGSSGLQGIFDIFKGGSGGGLGDITSRIQFLGPLTGIFDSANLGNTTNLPVLNQDRVSGLPGIISLVTGSNGIQAILNAFKGGTGGGITDIIGRIVNLGTGGLFDSAGLTNTSNLPVLNQDRVSGLPGIIGLVTGGNGIQAILDAFKGAGGGGVTDIISRIINLGTGGLFDSAGLTNTTNLPVLNQDRISGLPGILSLVTGSNGIQAILDAFKSSGGGLIGDVISRIQNLTTGGLFNASQLNNTASIPVLNQDRVTGLPSLFSGYSGLVSNLLTNPTAALGSLPDILLPGVKTIVGNIFGAITGLGTSTDHTHQEMYDAAAQQSDDIITASSGLVQLLAALGPGNKDADNFERTQALSATGTTAVTGWTFFHSGSGTIGIPNGHDLSYGGNVDDEWVGFRTSLFAAGDNQVVTMVFGTAPDTQPIFIPTEFGKNDLWIRMSNFASFAARTGVRLRFDTSGNKLRLSSYNAGTETLMTEITIPRPGKSTIMSLESGIGGNPRRFIAKIGGSPVIDWTEVGTASLYGPNYLRRGMGGRQENVLLVTARPGTTQQWTAQG